MNNAELEADFIALVTEARATLHRAFGQAHKEGDVTRAHNRSKSIYNAINELDMLLQAEEIRKKK